MKAMKIMRNIILGVVGLIYLVFVISMTVLLLNYNDFGVTEFGNDSIVIIDDEIKNENYEKGDLVVVEGKKVEDLKEGEEVFTYHADRNGVVSIDIGTIGQIALEERAISFENGSSYTEEFIVGQTREVYSNLGTYVGFITSQWGFFFTVLVPCFLIFVYQLYALIIEIKYGEEEFKFN